MYEFPSENGRSGGSLLWQSELTELYEYGAFDYRTQIHPKTHTEYMAAWVDTEKKDIGERQAAVEEVINRLGRAARMLHYSDLEMDLL